MFKVGDSAVYPAHGLAVIKRIEEKDVGGKKKKFYVLQVVDNQMTIMVPTDNVASVGLREIISTKDVKTVYDILKERKMLDQAKHLLVKEISLAKKSKEEVIEQEIQTIFAS